MGYFIKKYDIFQAICFLFILGYSLNAFADNAIVSWNANIEPDLAGYKVYYGTASGKYGAPVDVGNQITYTVTGLSAGTYYFVVTAYDTSGNESGYSNEASKTIVNTTPPDITPPVLSGIISSNVASNSAVITWNTNEAATSQVQYGTTTAYGSSSTLDSTLLTSHSVSLTGLSLNTAYHYQVISKDAAGNMSTSGDNTFATSATPDTTPPGDVQNFIGVGASRQITLSWVNPPDTDFVGVRILYRTDRYPTDLNDGTLLGDFSGKPNESMTAVHSGLQNGLTYYYSASAYDNSGNYQHTAHASAAPADPSLSSNGASAQQSGSGGGCAMILTHNGRSSSPRESADMLLLFGFVLVGLIRKSVRRNSRISVVNEGELKSAVPPRRQRRVGIGLTLAPFLIGCLSLLLSHLDASAATLQVGPNKTYTTVRAAAQASQDGDIIEIDAGLYTNDVATWSANNLMVRGMGGRAQLVVTNGTNQSGKGIWVVDGANFTAENIEFSGASVPDQNGAGIRAEGSGTFTARNCYFHDNEEGILSGNGNTAILIEYSIFDHNGYGDGYSHNMYIGHAQSFTLRYSYTHRAVIGHDVKSRAATNYILYNRIMDESDGTASYEVDVPDGGRTLLIGNVIEQGPNTDNSTIVSYAAESANNGALELYAVNNTIVNNRTSGGQFFYLRSGTTAVIKNNILYGPGTSWSGGSVTASNNYIEASYNNSPGFVNPQSYDFHLSANSPKGSSGVVDAAVSPGNSSAGEGLTPLLQYVYDAQAVARTVVGIIDIGAFEFSNSAPNTVPPAPPQNLKVK